MARAGLNIDRVVRAAIELADADGLAAVSMARVAERLGFTTMSLYRHLRSKEELLLLMLDHGLGPPPPRPPGDWRAGLEAWARGLVAILVAHPWAIDVPITGKIPTRHQLAWLDRGLEALADTSLSEDEKAEIVLLINGYSFWAARLAVQIPDVFEGPVVPPSLDLDGLPYLQRALAAGIFDNAGKTSEADFAFGLERVLDGVSVLVAARET